MRFLLLTFLILLISSCAVRQRDPERTDYVLTNTDGLILSNLHANPEGIRKEENKVKFNYNLIVKNASEAPVKIDLTAAHLQIDRDEEVIFCTDYQSKEATFTLDPLDTIKIVCRASIEAKERYKHRDHDVKINIPIGDTIAQYSYVIRIEDFQ